MLLQPLGIPTATATTAGTTRTTTIAATTGAAATVDEPVVFMDDYDIDSSCSTPYASAPSSPCRGNCPPISGFYYSAPTSPMHFILSAAVSSQPISSQPEVSSSTCSPCSFEFDFSASKTSTNGSSTAGSMSSADELFLNGQIRPMKLSTHLQRPQVLSPLLDLDETADDEPDDVSRGRDVKMRDRSLRRRTRSLSPLRNTAPFGWQEDFEVNIRDVNTDENAKNGDKEDCAAATASSQTTPCESGASSRSSSVGRSSSRWVFLKEFLYRSKSEGRNNGKFWGSLTFSPVKDRKIKMEKFMPSKITSGGSSKEKFTATSSATATSAATTAVLPDASASESSQTKQSAAGPKEVKKKAVNGVGKRRVPPSPHELHYTANRAQAEEMRKKTFLPYRQGLFGCLGFSSKSYGAMNGFARALNPVSSR